MGWSLKDFLFGKQQAQQPQPQQQVKFNVSQLQNQLQQIQNSPYMSPQHKATAIQQLQAPNPRLNVLQAAVQPTAHFVNQNFVQPTIKLASGIENPVAAGLTGVGGLARYGVAQATHNPGAAQRALNQTNIAMNNRLNNPNSLLTQQQAERGGTALVKPIINTAAQVAPFVVAPEIKGASAFMKIAKPAATFGAINAGSTAAQEATQGKINPKDVLQSAAYGAIAGAVGAGIPMAKRGVTKATQSKPIPENLLNKRVGLLEQRSIAETKNPKMLPFIDRQIAGVDAEIKSATRPLFKPMNQVGAVGKDVRPEAQKPVDPLITEALKHKNAEDFINSFGNDVYHGTNADIKSISYLQNGRKLSASGKNLRYVSDNPEYAATYGKNIHSGKQTGKVLNIREDFGDPWNPKLPKELQDYKTSPLLEGVDKRVIENSLAQGTAENYIFDARPNIVKYLQSKGISGIKLPRVEADLKNGTGSETIVFGDTLKTRQQLEDIYNKAHATNPVDQLIANKDNVINPEPLQAGQTPNKTQSAKRGTRNTKQQQTNQIPQNDNYATDNQQPLTGQKPNTPTQETPILDTSLKNRGFIKTVLEDSNTAPEVKSSIQSLYKVRNTKELQTKAANLVKSNPDLAMRIINSEDTSDIAVAVASEMIKKAQKAGDFETAIHITETIAPRLTEAGRAVQAASVYGKLTPEGILRFTQKELNKFNKETGKNIKLDPKKADKLTKMAEEAQRIPDGYEKQVAIAKLLAEVQKTMPSTVAQKMSTLQTMAQLLNLKTNVRNVLGNTIFGGVDNVSQVVATPIDALFSAIRGSERTTTLPSLKTQATSGVKGLKKGVKEAYQGINTGPDTQFDLNSVPVFRSKILGSLEKTMNATLRGSDRAAYEAAFDDTIRGLLKANKTNKVTPQMLEQAHYTGLYRTFQDTNALSDFFVGVKRSLNKIGIGTDGKRFGLGDLVLKYPKTPANLLARGIDYSPLGFTKALYEAGKPLMGKEFNQKAFVDSFSRAVVGSSVAFGTGYVLAKNGIITAQPEQNKDLRNLQKTAGLGGYQINASAFKRWLMSGLNKDAAKLRPGDTLVSYDWAQPIAIPVSAGAALGTEKPVKAGKQAASTVTNSVNTLAEQPLLTGITQLANNMSVGGLGQAAGSVITSTPASFVPTALNQAGQLMDNTVRNTKADGSLAGQSIAQVKAKIPGLSKTLPASVDVLGNQKERYQNGSNNLFNVTANPAFVNNYEPNTANTMTENLYQKTGETKQAPNTVPTTITVNGKDVKLNSTDQGRYQTYVGQMTNNAFNILSKNDKFNSLTPTQQVNLLSNIQTDINAAAKVQLFGDNPDKIPTSVQNIIDGNISKSLDLKINTQEKTSKPKTPKVVKGKTTKKASKGRTIRLAKAKLPRLKTSVNIKQPKSPKVRVTKLKSAKVSLRKPKLKIKAKM